MQCRVQVHESKSDMSRCNLARLGNKAYPTVVLDLFVEERHLGIWVNLVVFHSLVIHPMSSLAETAWHSKYLSSCPLFVLLLILLTHCLVYFYLRWLQLLLTQLRSLS